MWKILQRSVFHTRTSVDVEYGALRRLEIMPDIDTNADGKAGHARTACEATIRFGNTSKYIGREIRGGGSPRVLSRLSREIKRRRAASSTLARVKLSLPLASFLTRIYARLNRRVYNVGNSVPPVSPELAARYPACDCDAGALA